MMIEEEENKNTIVKVFETPTKENKVFTFQDIQNKNH